MTLSIRFVAALMRRRAWVLLGLGVITVGLGYSSTRLRFDNSIETWFLDGDPEIVTYSKFLDRFASDEISVIGVFADDVFAPETLAVIDRLSRAAKKVPFAHAVRSLTTVKIFDNQGDVIEIRPLMRALPKTRAAAARLKAKALENPLLRDLLVSKDARGAAIIIELTAEGNDFEGKREQVVALERLVEAERRRGITLYLSGSPAFDVAFLRRSNRDFALLSPVSVGLVMLAIFIVFRRISAALIPLAVVGLACVWTFGLMGAVGVKVDILTSGLLALIVAVGVADSVHVLSDYYRQLAGGETDKRRAVEQALSGLMTPIFFTSMTTAAGFLSLLASDLAPIRRFGWQAAVGVSFAFLISVTLVPVILGLARAPSVRFTAAQEDGALHRLLMRAARLSRRASLVIVLLVSPLLGLSVWGVTKLKVGANPINYFRPDDPARVAAGVIDARLGGATSIEFLVKAPNQGLKDPQVLARLERLQRWIERRPGVTRTLSVVDSLKEINRVLHGGDPAQAKLPTSREMAAQLYLLFENEEQFKQLVQADYSIGRITARVQFTAADKLTHETPIIVEKLAREFSDETLQVKVTGFIKLMNDMENYLVSSQSRSLMIAFGVITLMMFVLLRSVRLGALSMIPNLVPIALGLGFMALVGIGLDPGTVMIGSITMGLVVDDTVHFLVRLRRESRAGVALEVAIERTMAESGRPIVVTSVVLAAGFFVMVLGSFLPNFYFGLVTALVISIALLADLLLLPAVLKLIRPKLVPEGMRNERKET